MAKSNIEFLAYEETPLGPLCLRRRELLSQPGIFVTEVTLNHEFLMSSLYTDSEQALAQLAVDMHSGEGLEVMIAGLGLGYTAHQAVQSNQVSCVEVVELLPQVIEWMNTGLVPLSSKLVDNPKLTIKQGDAYLRLAGTPLESEGGLFDIILIDVDHSPDDRLGDGQSESFYTAEGIHSAKLHLAVDGILGVWSYAENSPFAEVLRDSFQEVRVEPVTHQNELIGEEHTDWLFFAR